MAHASLERQLAAAHTTKMELETKLREKDLLVERLERDRRWFADREKEEREEKERERDEHDEEKVRMYSTKRLLVSRAYTNLYPCSGKPIPTSAPSEVR
jgi:mitotic spindle assembly checkpoint protein MAD1